MDGVTVSVLGALVALAVAIVLILKKVQPKAPPQRVINQIPFMSRARGHRIISGGLALHYIG